MKTATGCNKVRANNNKKEPLSRFPRAVPSPALKKDLLYTNPVSSQAIQKGFIYFLFLD